MDFTWDQVRAWRMTRQLLDRPAGTNAASVVERLCGVQAQVGSSADQAVSARLSEPLTGETGKALANRELIKTWAMRGTLHLLTPAHAAAALSLVGAARGWEKGTWQRHYITVDQVAALADAVRAVLPGRLLTREELNAELIRHTRDDTLAEHLASGWGVVLKPLACLGLLCHGPADGNRITFTTPETLIDDWPGMPEPADAARTLVPAYLGAYGPASADTFDQWLVRGTSKKAMLRGWFTGLADGGEITAVTVEGRPAYARTADLAALAAAEPSPIVRLLPAFDQFVLGPGTSAAEVIDPARRAAISKAAGWIAPVVVVGGRVAGVWEPRDGITVTLFAEGPAVTPASLEAEAARWATVLGGPATLHVHTG